MVLKFFLNLSKGEQKRRLLARINTPEKNWKFSTADAKERSYWDEYMNAFEDTFNHTSTEWARHGTSSPPTTNGSPVGAVADVIAEKLQSPKSSYPVVSQEQRQHLLEAKERLENEPSSRNG